MEKNQDKQQIRRYLNGAYNSHEAKEMAESLLRADKEGILDDLADEVWEEALSLPEPSDQIKEQYKKEAQHLLESMQSQKRSFTKRILYMATGIAASILVIWGAITMKQQWDIQHITVAQATTGFGEKKELTLPDGSQIILNACSKLEYPSQFIGDKREVQLVGEAYFKVQSNPEQPFLIQTSDFQVEVLGTEFNVKSYAHDQIQSVEVENGKVQVTLPEDRIRLKKQEQIYLNKQSGEYSKLKRSENKVAAWRNGALHFYQTPLTDVAKELERRYHCKISFRQGEVFENLISGEHDNQSLESVLESLHYICGINYEKDGNQIAFYK